MVYRYSLTRVWDRDRSRVCFVMLNPSTADETHNDPTIRRCIGFSDRWGYGSLIVVNLFAFRTHDPRILKATADPLGADNNGHVIEAARDCGLAIAAWGVRGHRHEHSRRLMSQIQPIHCLGVTKNGAPKHPLYVRGNAEPRAYITGM